METSMGPACSERMQPDELPSHTKGLVSRNLTATDTCCSVVLMLGTNL